MYRINFAMEDSLRDLMYRMVSDYTKLMKQFCPDSVEVLSNDTVTVKGGKFPLFTVDLKFVNAVTGGGQLSHNTAINNQSAINHAASTGAPPSNTPAKFVYSASVETLFNAIMTPFDQSFKNFKDITKVERRVMKKLFWAYDPMVSCPHVSEKWAQDLREKLVVTIS